MVYDLQESEPSDSEVEDDENDDNLNVLADAAIAQLGLTEPYPQMQVSRDFLLSLVPLYKGGNISSFSSNWEKLTSDVNIISIVKYGLTLRVRGNSQSCKPFAYGCSDSEQALLNEEIRKMLDKSIIVPSHVYSSDFFSPVFLRENGMALIVFHFELEEVQQTTGQNPFQNGVHQECH